MRKHEAAFRLSPARIVSCGGDASGSRGVRADAADSQQLAVSGLDSNLGKHEKLLTSGQSMLFLVTLSFAQAFGRRTTTSFLSLTVDVWLVKTGKTLRALSDDLLSFAAKLSQATGSIDTLPAQFQKGVSLTADIDQTP